MKFSKSPTKQTTPKLMTTTPSPAPFCRLSPTVRPTPAPAPAPLTPEEVALYAKFKAHEQEIAHPVSKKIQFVAPPQPTARTIKLNELLALMTQDSPPYIAASRAWLEIKTDELWKDRFSSFKQCCQDRMMPVHWIEEFIANIPIFESLSPGNQRVVKSQDELSLLAKFKKADRVAILTRIAARGFRPDEQAANRIQDAARALGLKPEAQR